MFKRTAIALLGLLLSAALVIAVEVWLALNRQYLATEPALELGGTFGPRDGTPLRFVVLGDSTAAGLGAGTPEHAYATVIAERLADKGHRVELTALGVSGARVATVLESQVPMALDAEADLIFVGIGANDATHLTPLSDVERDMGSILSRLEETGATIVIAGAPDMRAHAWHEPLRTLAGWRGRQVTERIEEVARRHDVPIVELAEETGRLFSGSPEEFYAADYFHPGPAGYRAWADAIYPVLERALTASRPG